MCLGARQMGGWELMRILVLFPGPVRGGCEEHALMVIRWAVSAGYTIVPCCVVNEATASVIDELESLGLAVTPWELGTVGDDWISWGTAEEQRVRACQVLSGVVPPDYPVAPQDRTLGAFARRCRQLWVTVSEDSRRQLIRAFDIEESTRIRVVRNGRDLPVAWRNPDQAMVRAARVSRRAEFGLPAAARVALTVAMLSAPRARLFSVANSRA
jgi:hypothetical protein